MRYSSTAVEFPNKNHENPNKQRNTRHFLGLLDSRHVCVGLLRAAFAGSGAGPEGAGGIPPVPSPGPRAPLPLRGCPALRSALGSGVRPVRIFSAFPLPPAGDTSPAPSLRGLLPPHPLCGGRSAPPLRGIIPPHPLCVGNFPRTPFAGATSPAPPLRGLLPPHPLCRGRSAPPLRGKLPPHPLCVGNFPRTPFAWATSPAPPLRGKLPPHPLCGGCFPRTPFAGYNSIRGGVSAGCVPVRALVGWYLLRRLVYSALRPPTQPTNRQANTRSSAGGWLVPVRSLILAPPTHPTAQRGQLPPHPLCVGNFPRTPFAWATSPAPLLRGLISPAPPLRGKLPPHPLCRGRSAPPLRGQLPPHPFCGG